MLGSPLASSADRRSRGAWALLLGAATLSLLLWAALDQRPPDDHDAWYTHHVIGFMNDLAGMSPPRAVARFGFFAWAESDHPPVASIGTWATLATFGTSLFVYRMATLPFFLLLVTGATLAGWELLGRRWGFLTGLLVAGLPSVVNASRKADFVFHAAGLSAVCLALALGLALRRPRSPGPWLAFGAVAGLRMNSHSLSVVDLGALAAALVVLELAARRRGTEPLRMKPALLGVGLALLIGAPLLGAPLPGLGMATWSLPKYWHFGGQYVVGSDPLALEDVGRAVRFGALGLTRHHWTPLVAALLFIPGLLAAPWACLARASDDQDARLREGLRFLGIVVGLQAPVILLTLARGAVLRDWIAIAAASTLLAVGSLVRLGRRRSLGSGIGRAWAGLLGAHAVFVLFVPTLASALGPDPLADWSAYTRPPVGLFAEFDGRGREHTHHLVSRTPAPAEAVAAALVGATEGWPPSPEVRPPAALISGGGLALDVVAARAAGCSGPDGVGCCTWNDADPVPPLGTTRWPFVFAGFGDGVVVPVGRARFHIELLTIDGEEPLLPWEDPSPLRAWASDGCVDRAVQAAAARHGVPTDQVQVLADPARWLIPVTDDRTTYTSVGLLVDRGVGEVVEW